MWMVPYFELDTKEHQSFYIAADSFDEARQCARMLYNTICKTYEPIVPQCMILEGNTPALQKELWKSHAMPLVLSSDHVQLFESPRIVITELKKQHVEWLFAFLSLERQPDCYVIVFTSTNTSLYASPHHPKTQSLVDCLCARNSASFGQYDAELRRPLTAASDSDVWLLCHNKRIRKLHLNLNPKKETEFDKTCREDLPPPYHQENISLPCSAPSTVSAKTTSHIPTPNGSCQQTSHVEESLKVLVDEVLNRFQQNKEAYCHTEKTISTLQSQKEKLTKEKNIIDLEITNLLLQIDMLPASNYRRQLVRMLSM